MPTPRKRSVACLRPEEREEISRGLVAGLSFRQIAKEIGRSASTISREVGRNGGRRKYRATMADGRAWQQALRPKPCLLAANPPLRSMVEAKLQDQWSPQQILGWLKTEHGSPTRSAASRTIPPAASPSCCPRTTVPPDSTRSQDALQNDCELVPHMTPTELKAHPDRCPPGSQPRLTLANWSRNRAYCPRRSNIVLRSTP